MDTRLVIGLSLDSTAREVLASLVSVSGIRLDCRVTSQAWVTFPVDDDDPLSVARTFAEAARGVADQARMPFDRIAFAGIAGDVDSAVENGASQILSRFAELTGCTAIGGFSNTDRAAGGRGKPLVAIVDWLIANDQRFSRLVLHLDATTEVVCLPAAGGPNLVSTFESGPGISFLDSLASALSQGRHPPDPQGRLAVQGRQIKPLVRRWAAHPFLRQAPPKVLPPGEFAGSFLDETVRFAAERGWSMADVLCTASHFVAACPADAIRQFLNKIDQFDQVVLLGRGTRNGFLLRLIEEQFSGLGIATVSLPGVATEPYAAIASAVLGCLTLDGVAGNLPRVTGAAGPRLLGSISPGASSNWRQCLDWMHRMGRTAELRVA